MSKLTFIIITILILIAPARAYFRDPGVGARPAGMGGAYVATADDANAVLWNAAGLAQLSKREITAMFSALYVGLGARLYNEKTDMLGYHFIGYAHPSELGSFAISWCTFQSQLYDENTFCLSYGRKLKEYLYAGLNLKSQGWSIGVNEYTRLDKDISDHGTSKTGRTLDLSILYKTSNGFSFGFSGENLIPADVGLSMEENIPLNLRGGIAFRVHRPMDTGMNILYALDIMYREGDKANFHVGLESWFLNGSVGARAGWSLNSTALGLSYRASRESGEIQLDYAFIHSTSIQETYGSHRMSMSVRF